MNMQREVINSNECQYASLKSISEGNAWAPPASLMLHIKLAVRRYLTPGQHRKLKRQFNFYIDRFSCITGKPDIASGPFTNILTESLKEGDLVRVKSQADIKATLNNLGETKGCAFMADIMTAYCGTVQRVLKPMERFVDERDLRVKKCNGLILLEGVMCEGTTIFGRCDRSCFMFWREEWLEKIG